ncbi:alpha-L-fucosidase [Streptomyces spinoverrucosus]|uniref:alpha-L-fucosidase n=1 Tax=Streptomyces spinoverrucosus TaxID=284043 RepID=A0A4Y3VC59_9ACTN|nr:alpha-L-fucosidase [Streptomyces spinoverrucosus]GEC03865.1 alpha-L-fucosidase [Streptomyces spinoverrucosus]GHB49757.1 alpha-L-fucosidase [Streptomyces spinoverrucosus]
MTAAAASGRARAPALAAVRPSERQLTWQTMEFYGFIHFGMNTVTDREWGEGHDDPALFDPAGLDADQWVATLKSAGMTGVILTCKHHDGFCLWPSDVTAYSVASSPWLGGQGDVVAEVAAAARRHGLRFGIYLSPWDRHDASYGSGTAYDDFYVAQLTELLTRYGPVFSVWLDGANGEGPNGKVQVYDWERYYAVVRELQPDAVISVCGPDVRWCGNEAGDTRPDEWSVVPRALQDAERTADRSQQTDDGTFARLVRNDDRDLGSRTALAGHEDDLVWYPAEVNTSIRPGWFHHPAEDAQVRPVDELFTIYLRAVGGNSCFLLNVPPARDGRIRDTDVAVLERLGRRIEDFRARRIEATATVSSGTPGDIATAWPGAGRTPWRPDDTDPRPGVTLAFGRPRPVEAVVVGEDITQGQRIEHVVVRGRRDGRWTTLAEAHAVGYQRILTFAPTEVDAVLVEVTEARDTPVVARAAAIGGAS